MSNRISLVDDGLIKAAATCTASLVAELGRGNREKLTLMKERNEQNEKIVSIAGENHATVGLIQFQTRSLDFITLPVPAIHGPIGHIEGMRIVNFQCHIFR